MIIADRNLPEQLNIFWNLRSSLAFLALLALLYDAAAAAAEMER